MKKLSKLILASTLAVALLAGNSATSMAAEQPKNIVGNEVVYNTIQPRAVFATYYYEGTISKGKTLSPLSINSGNPKTIRYRVNGSGGNVIFRITHRSTGESRSFTTIADDTWRSTSYLNPLDTGIYDVTVYFVSGSGHNKVWLEFNS